MLTGGGLRAVASLSKGPSPAGLGALQSGHRRWKQESHHPPWAQPGAGADSSRRSPTQLGLAEERPGGDVGATPIAPPSTLPTCPRALPPTQSLLHTHDKGARACRSLPRRTRTAGFFPGARLQS